jgi:ATP-dependent DNA helicase RecG
MSPPASLRPAPLFPWFTPVTRLKGVGPAVTAALTKLLPSVRPVEDDSKPLPVVRDLLFHMPGGVIDRTRVTPVAQLEKGQYATIEVTVSEHKAPPRTKHRLPYKVSAHDATGNLVLTFFHVKGDYLIKQLPVGEKRLICGVVDMYDGFATISHPDVIARVENAAEVLKLAPSYPLTAGISQKMLSRLEGLALQAVLPLPEWQDAEFLKQQSWPAFTEALKAIHQPLAPEAVLPSSPARMRLAYDELLANQLALALARQMQQRQKVAPMPFDERMHADLLAALPFTLTGGQQAVFQEMMADLVSGQRMVRLLQGDVGSGKTVLAFALMLQVVAHGGQACLMAPTDLLARQHFATLKKYADALHIPLALLTGKMRKGERVDIQNALSAGKIPLVVGTHALFQDEVAFNNLRLVVVDEQHRFGVGQRMRLTAKGDAPHLLQMTATPIPRSLSMTLYGDMEISSLTERPPGRKEIDTRAVPDARMDEVIDGLKRVLAAGEKAYWVCPLIERQDNPDILKSDLAAAEERFRLLETHFPGKVGLVHGKMKLAEREKVMQRFASEDLQLLVATTVIEVGVDVREATVMVIEHAERFGLAQMHQLRGRVGRNDKVSRCILLYHDKPSQQASDRLKILRQSNDGFLIAEEDLRLRGEGDMVGTRQTGLPDYVLVDLSVHLPLIRIANDDVRLLLNNDPALRAARGQALRLLLGLFEYEQAMAQLKTI